MTRRTRPMRHARTPVSSGPSRRLTRRGITVGAAIGLTLSALPAWAYWTTSASTSASASADILQPPSTVSGSANGTTDTTITVTGVPGAGPTPTSYRVLRGGNQICPSVTLGQSCQDTGLSAGSTYTYDVVSLLGAWVSADSVSVQVTTAPNPPVVQGLTDGTDTGAKGDSYTSNPAPAFHGTAQPGTTVRLVIDQTLDTAATVADSTGDWNLAPATAPVANVQHSVKARATLHGSTSADSTAFILLVDTVKPTTGTASIACSAGSVGGFCRTARVNVPSVADSAPSSGFAGVDYTVNAVASSTPATVVNGNASFTVAGVSGKPTVSYQARDVADNSSALRSAPAFTFTLDATAPTVSSVTLANGGPASTGPGVLDKGDAARIQFADTGSGFSPASICPSTWSSSTATTPTDVTVTVADTGASDQLSVTTTSSCGGAPRIGTINLSGNYVTGGGSMTFSGTGGNASMLSWDSANAALTITLGKLVAGGTGAPAPSAAATAKPVFTPDAAISDLVGNTISTTPFTAGTASRF